jgi:phosphatidylserine/phosphatidylglycerophosphate/cardiolipin synthase-like enzyme
MAKFLDTKDIISSVQRILKNAKERIILISPYIDFDKRDKTLIEEQNKNKVYITIINGKKKNQLKFGSDIKNWIKSMDYVKHIFHKELHAKCYLNEEEAVITSMNLYEASQKNSEMGILISKRYDSEAYDDLLKEVKRIVNEDKPGMTLKESPKKKHGFCIRCKSEIKLDPTHPYCKKDYQQWNKFKDENYEEKNGVCHICGKSNKSSLKKPACIDCYKKNKSLF